HFAGSMVVRYLPWGSRPRLYADACFARYKTVFVQSQSKIEQTLCVSVSLCFPFRSLLVAAAAVVLVEFAVKSFPTDAKGFGCMCFVTGRVVESGFNRKTFNLFHGRRHRDFKC